MATNGHDAAFATATTTDTNGITHWGEFGLTKREYIATQLATGMLGDTGELSSAYESGGESVAAWAVRFADALIAALNRGIEPAKPSIPDPELIDDARR